MKVYGIDLGTTNSIIGRDGVLYSGLVASNVNISKKEQVPRDTYGTDVVSSYKVNMGLGEAGKVPVFCSSIVLKELAKQVKERTEEDIKDVCISVPAYFATTQREAVKKAAELAGLNLLRIINEPTAAAIYVCRDNRELVIVYDLGGGTFDVTLIDSRDGTYQTIATDGQILGGDDLDLAIYNFIIKKYNVQMRYRTKANKDRLISELRLVKERIQKTREDQPIDLMHVNIMPGSCLTVEEYKELVRKTFEPTLVKTQSLIDNYVQSYDKPKIIYTGGSTYCPFLMELLQETFDFEELSYSVERDMLVAHGISYIAKLVEDGNDQALISNVTKRLSVELDTGDTYTIIEDNTILPCRARYPFINMRTGDTMVIKLYQGNNYYAKDNDYIGALEYKFNEVKEAGQGMLNVDILVTYDGYVKLKCFNQDETEESAKSVELHIL